jgi:hypothetical protein
MPIPGSAVYARLMTAIGRRLIAVVMLVLLVGLAAFGYRAIAPQLTAQSTPSHRSLHQRQHHQVFPHRRHRSTPMLTPAPVETTTAAPSTTVSRHTGSSGSGFYANRQIQHDEQLAHQAEKHASSGFYANKQINHDKHAVR